MKMCKILALNSKYFSSYSGSKMVTGVGSEPSRVHFGVFLKFGGLYLSSECIYETEILCVWILAAGQ